MPEVKDLIKDFYAKYDKDAYSEEKAAEIEEYYKGDISSLAKDFYAKYDKDSYSEEKISDLVDYYSDKKKDQEELPQEELPQEETPQMEVQEDTESVSEDGSLVSQDWGGDQKKPVRTALTVEEEDFKTLEEKGKLEKPEEKITLESFGTPSTEEEKIKESEVYIAKKQDEAENAVSVFLEKNNLNSIDVLPSDISESVKEMYPGTYTSSIERALYSVRNKELNSAAEDLINKERESIISGNSDLGKVSKEVADSLMYKKTLESSLKSLGLSDDDYQENVDAIKTRYNSLIQISNLKKEFKNASDSRKRQIIEEVEELKELSKLSSDKLSFLRENNKAFTDEEGNVNKDLKRDVESREVAFNKEFKSDYVKIIDRLAKEKAKKDALIKKLAEAELEVKKQNPEFYNNFDLDFESAEKGLSLNLGFSSDYLNAPNPKDYISSENREKQMSYRQLFSEANKNLLALSRLALLNEDPAAVAKGFEFLKGTKIEGVGKFITAATETIAEEITGDDVVTDRDFRQNAINVLRQEGVNLTPDQLEAGEQDFSETLGDTFGVSTVMGGKIALTSYMLGGIGNALKLPSYLARIKYLRESPRLVSFIDKTMKAVGEGLAFELADDRTDFFMGVGESGGKGAMKLLGKALASSKFGKFSKYLDNYVGRFATNLTGRIVGGVTEEYSGEWISEGVKNGFFTQEQFENTFGKGQQAAEKFILNIALAGGMGLPSSFIESVKSRADQDQTGELRKAVDAYEEGLKSKPEIKKETLDKVEEKGGLSEMTTEEIEGTLKEEDLEVLTAEKEKIKLDDKKEEEPVPSAVEEGQEPGDIQVDETGEEEATTGGVLQEEEVVTEGQQVSSDMVVDDELSNPDEVAKPTQLTVEEAKSLVDDSSVFAVTNTGSKSKNRPGKPGELMTNDWDGLSHYAGGDNIISQVYINKDTGEQVAVVKGNSGDYYITSTVGGYYGKAGRREGFTIAVNIGKDLNNLYLPNGVLKVFHNNIIKNALNQIGKPDSDGNYSIDAFVKNGKAVGEAVKKGWDNIVEKYTPKSTTTTDTTTEENVVPEADTFTQEELDQEITKDNIQSTIDKIESLQKKIRSNTKSDLGFSAALDAILTLTKVGLRTAKTFRDAYNAAVDKFKKQDGYKKLTDEQKNKLDSFSEKEFFDALNEESKKGIERGDTFNKAKESYKESREAGLDIKESISESFKTIERADWYKSLTKEEQAEIKADYVNRLVPNFESGGKPPKRNRKGKPPVDSSRKIITTEKKSLLAQLKNKAKGAKTLMKAQTGLINELFKEISNSSKSLTSNELKAVLKKASKLNPADITEVLEFKDEVKKLIDKGEIRDKKKLAFSNRARINKAKKKLTGKKKAFADTFSKLNINRVTDLDAYNEVAQSIIDSANKRKASSLEIIKKLGDRVISETNKAQEEFNAERQRLSDIALEEEFEAFQESMYEKSSFKKRGGSLEEYKKFLSSEEGFMSLEDYKRIKEQAYRESLSNQSREKIEQAEQQLRDFISNRLEYLKSNKESITKDMTPFEKAVVNDLIKSASLLKRTDLTSSDNLFDISQALDEILTFNSTSGVNKASVALDAIRDSNIAKIRLKDKLASGILAGYPTAGSLSTYVKAATKNEQAAKEFASLFFGKYNDSFNKSQNKTEQFLKRRAEKRNELKIKRKESQRIGIVSWLMQHDEGSTEEEIQLDLDQKKESIKQQIKTLSGSKGNASDRRKAKRMQEAYDSLGLDNVKTKKELNALLNKNELDFLNFLTEEFQELKQPLQDAYSAAKGEDLTFVENYLPTFARKYSDTSKEDLEGLVFDNKSIQSNPSGRTKKRTKIDTTGNVIYNFDVLGTTEAGYSQAAGDIYTLYDKQVLSQVVMSKPVKELWKNDPKGYRTFKERVALLLKNRNPNYATDAARANRFLQISNNILRTAIALPLRTTDQLGKQVVPIIGNTVAKLVLSKGRPVAGVKGFSYLGSLMGSDSSPTKQNLKKLLSFSNTSLRVLEGDRDLAATKGLTEQAQKKILEAVRLGKLNEKVLSKLGSGALGFADKLASQGSWLSFYINERINQEGKGFKFDLEKEAENPNMKAIEKANVETDWINNKSDMTTAAKSVYENKKTALIVKDLFFLFKSFAINQSYNTALDIRNIGYGVSKAFKKKESKEGRQDVRDAAGSLLGTVAGVYLFEMVKESFIKPGTDELVEALFDIEDPDPEKEVLGDIKRDSKQALMKGAMDIVVGAAPESISRGFKEYANSLIIDAAKEDYEELKNKFPGADIEPFNEYKEKVFYDKSSAPGFLGRTADLGAEAFRDFQIITGDEGLGQEDQFGREKELSPKMKTIALFNMLAPFVGAGDVKKYTEKALRNAKKNAKNKK